MHQCQSSVLVLVQKYKPVELKGDQPAVATTQALASAAAHELSDLDDDDWHRVVLVL